MIRLALNLLAAFLAATFLETGTSAIAQTAKVELLWLGQSAFRITTPTGKVIMIDPYLTNNPTTPPQYKNLDAIGKLDLILVSHAHYDHFEDAVPLAKKNDVPRSEERRV